MTTSKKKKKSARERRVLVASIICAGLIVAGSTFAWFTSTDEVTNRLSASADYGVTIAEDFTPPENWIPGQEIEKNVYVTNTGNVDAFVRVWLEGEFNLIAEDINGLTATPSSAYAPTEFSNGENDKLKELGYEKITDGSTTSYVKRLSTTKTVNPANSNVTGNQAQNDGLSEVQSLQAGGFLAYAPSGAKYKYTINQNKAVNVYYDASNNAVTDIVAGSVVVVGDTAAAPNTDATSGVTTYIAPANQSGDIDSDTFVPMTTGLYLFRRNMDVVPDGATDSNWKYSGYYYVAANSDTGGQGKYYALQTETTANSEQTVYAKGISLNDNAANPSTWYVDQQTGAFKTANTSTSLANVKLFTATASKVEDDDLTWTYTAADSTAGTPAKLTATITSTASEDAKKISVDIALANIATTETGDKWQRVAAPTTGSAVKRDTFYYKNDLEEGDTTAKLVDSVTLNKDTKQTAYIAFDFDLNVLMDSIQVTLDADDNECFTSVKDEWASSTKAVAQTADETVGKEINNITWKNKT